MTTRPAVSRLLLPVVLLFLLSLGPAYTEPVRAGSGFWTALDGPIGGWVSAIALSPNFAADSTLYIGTSTYDAQITPDTYGGLWKSADGGDSWTRIGLEDRPVHSIAVSGSAIFAGSIDLYRSLDSGTSWSLVDFEGLGISAISISSHGVLVGAGGIWQSTDNGDTWVRIGLDGKDVRAIAVSDSGNIFAGVIGDGAGIYRSTDGGTTWNPVGLAGYWIRSFAVSGTTIFAGSSQGAGAGLFRSQDDGSTWSQNALTGESIWAIAVEGTRVIAGSARGGNTRHRGRASHCAGQRSFWPLHHRGGLHHRRWLLAQCRTYPDHRRHVAGHNPGQR